MQKISVAFLAAANLAAEVHTLTLTEAVRRALEQNHEVVIARLEERKALYRVTIARDPFIPKVYAGSGLAYTNGFPLSIEGSAPSIVQARAVASLINRPESHRLAQAKEMVRASELDTAEKRNAIAIRTVELYLNAERLMRDSQLLKAQADGLERVAKSVRARGGRTPATDRDQACRARSSEGTSKGNDQRVGSFGRGGGACVGPWLSARRPCSPGRRRTSQTWIARVGGFACQCRARRQHRSAQA